MATLLMLLLAAAPACRAHGSSSPGAPCHRKHVQHCPCSAVAKLTGPKIATSAVTLGYVLLW